MKKRTQKIILLFLYIFILANLSITSNADISNDINFCLKKISAKQAKEDQELKAPLKFKKYKGIYSSWVHLYFHEDLGNIILRNKMKFYDNNYFVTAWIDELLLDSKEVNKEIEPESLIFESFENINMFYDKNNESSSNIIFWPENNNPTLLDNGGYVYPANPINLLSIMTNGSSTIKSLERFAKMIGVEEWFKKVEHRYTLDHLDNLKKSFMIPPDADDSSLNISMGCMIKSLGDKYNSYKQLYNTWKTQNSDVKINNTIRSFSNYAYSPTGKNSKLDPRTYYFAQKFLEENPSFLLLTTWLMSEKEEKNYYPYMKMPDDRTNNIDVTVCANFINSMARYAATYPNEFDQILKETPNLKQLILNTSDYLVWVLSNDKLSLRPDIGSLYYPSPTTAYWFIARSISFLSSDTNFLNMSPKGQEIFSCIYDSFNECLKKITLKIIMPFVKNSNEVFWENFIGTNDIILKKIKFRNPDDRLFSTAIVLNLIIDTWTLRKNTMNGYTLTWKNDSCVSDIKSVVERGIKSIRKMLKNPLYKKENAFFTGAIKSKSSVPYAYPGLREDFIGNQGEKGVIYSINGIINHDEYQQLCDDLSTPNEFKGFCECSAFAYWSSPALTYALVLNVLSKYLNLNKGVNINI